MLQPRLVGPPPWSHANSVPETFTPARETAVPPASTRWFPDTRTPAPSAPSGGRGEAVEDAVEEDPRGDGERPGVAAGVGVGELLGDPVAMLGAAEGRGTTTVAVLGAVGPLLKISVAAAAPV